MFSFVSTDDRYILGTPEITGLPTGFHPVVFEIGYESNTGLIWPPVFRMNFPEFKFTIPYVVHKEAAAVSDTFKFRTRYHTYKSNIFVDRSILARSSRTFYGLHTRTASVTISEDRYLVKHEGAKFVANFHAETTQWGKPSDYPNFKIYKDIMDQTWFGSLNTKVCGKHKYNFDQALVRPANSRLLSETGILTKHFPNGPIFTDGINRELGSAEVKISWTMTNPFLCQGLSHSSS